MNLAIKAALPVLAITCALAVSQTDADTQARGERLAKHAELFGVYNSNRRFENTKPNPAGVIDLSVNMRNDYFIPPGISTPEDELTRAARLADAVVEGETVQQYSALTARHSFVFSDWTVKVIKAFKTGSQIPVPAGGEIIVTRPGGDAIVNGQHVTAHDKAFPDFALGHQYVLYLHALPDGSSFQVMSCAVFDVSGSSPVPLLDPDWKSTTLRAFGSPVSTADFLATVARSAAQ
ncbi:MAG: hypothetical protein ABSF22_15400 [Bryobacteraceae bacterium]|jgi:hypothetical protein